MAQPAMPLLIVKVLVTGPTSPYSAAERLVALAISDYLNNIGGKERPGYPTYVTLAGWTGLSVMAVRRAAKVLSTGADPVFRREKRRTGKQWARSYYWLAPGAAARAKRILDQKRTDLAALKGDLKEHPSAAVVPFAQGDPPDREGVLPEHHGCSPRTLIVLRNRPTDRRTDRPRTEGDPPEHPLTEQSIDPDSTTTAPATAALRATAR